MRKAASESSSFCNFPREYFLAADRGDVYIIKGHKNLKAFISLLLIQKWCIHKVIFLKKVCLGVGFPSRVSSSRESGKCECQVIHQRANIMRTKIIQICGSFCYKQPKVLGFKRTKMFVLSLATFHLKDFREK